MSRKLRLSVDARSDIKEIRDYIATNSKEAAKAFNFQMAEAFASLCDMPLMGRQRDDLSKDLRSFVVGKYIIFYCLVGNNSLEVVRLLHSARDVTSLFN